METFHSTLLTSLLLVASTATAADFARVTAVQGAVSFEGSKLEAGQTLPGPGIVSAEIGGSARLTLSSGTEIRVNSGTRVRIEADSAEILSGTLRFFINRKNTPAGGKPKFNVRTKSAVMGVRGTDFMSIFNPNLNESEIVVFAGEVRFESVESPSDFKNVKAGQWGGIGGRYRRQMGELIDLPQGALEAFRKQTE